MNRKLLKPQVEKRRRERINQSLENLKTLLLQGTKYQGVTQRRVEKSEILEHTVLFLQNTGSTDRKKAEAGEQQHLFQDGFSACQHRAVHFLGQEREGLQLDAALNTSLSARLNSTEALVTANLSNTLSITSRLKTQESHTRQQLCALRRKMSTPHPHRDPLQHVTPKASQQTCTYAAKEAHTQNLSISQTVWRPWP